MIRLIWGEVRHRAGRTLAVLMGVLIATTSFTVLLGTSQTSQAQVRGTVSNNFRSAYDVLVRPSGSTTGIEAAQALVRPNYLSGIFGGITLRQWHQVQAIPGVQVAAPIAMIGNVLQRVSVPVSLASQLDPAATQQLFSVSVRRSTDRGLTNFGGEQSGYVYVTNRPLRPVAGFPLDAGSIGPREVLPGGGSVQVCPFLKIPPTLKSAFDPAARESIDCWSRVNGPDGQGFAGQPVSAQISWSFPFLLAAVDPTAEAQLAGVDKAVTTGRYLNPSDTTVSTGVGSDAVLQVPVLASTTDFTDDLDQVTIRRLPEQAAAAMTKGLSPAQVQALVANQPGRVVLTRRVDATQAYHQLLSGLASGGSSFVDSYWSTGPTTYTQTGPTTLTPQSTSNPAATWKSSLQGTGFVPAPIDNTDVGFRRLTPHLGSNQGAQPRLPSLRAVGQFDPNRLPGFNPLTQVPLETYNPPTASPSDERTRSSLGGRNLTPNGNIAGYLQSPPLLLTTLNALPTFTDPDVFTNTATTQAAPLSVIRVRVAGVTGPDPLSLARIRTVAQQIQQVTGLSVDITAGSSPTPRTIALPPGNHGRPELSLKEGWVKKGVALVIINGIDRKSLILTILILAVCALFVINAASAAVRAKRTELAVLSCLGWSPGRLFAVTLLELALIGLTAGAIGSLLALPLADALHVQASLPRAALAVPAAVGLSVLAGLGPARRAARAVPAEALRPPVQLARRAYAPRSVLALGLTNLVRVPGRSLLGAASLAVGVAALTLLLALAIAFKGVLVGSLLGDAVSVQVQRTDYVTVAVIIVLGVLSVADVLYLNIRERAAEFTTLRVTGWDQRYLAQLVTIEGLGMGLLGSIAGATLAVAAAALFAGGLTLTLLLIGIGVAAVGTALAAIAAIIPVILLRRLPASEILSGE